MEKKKDFMCFPFNKWLDMEDSEHVHIWIPIFVYDKINDKLGNRTVFFSNVGKG